jgi:hypothetical protein
MIAVDPVIDPALDTLLSDLAGVGAKLSVRGVKLIIDAPDAAISRGLADRIRASKEALVLYARLNSPCEHCGSTSVNDVPIHVGRSVRRDCALCNRTLGFPHWNSPK